MTKLAVAIDNGQDDGDDGDGDDNGDNNDDVKSPASSQLYQSLPNHRASRQSF